jgi:hypothetical protein
VQAYFLKVDYKEHRIHIKSSRERVWTEGGETINTLDFSFIWAHNQTRIHNFDNFTVKCDVNLCYNVDKTLISAQPSVLSTITDPQKFPREKT